MLRLAAVTVTLPLLASPSSAQVLDVRTLTTTQVAALDRARTAIVIEGGILEEHGPYLPSYSDGYQSEYIASAVARAIAARPGWTAVRFPPLPLGSFAANEIGERYTFPGSFPVRSATLRAVLMDWATDLGEAGFRWVFVVNMHGAPAHNDAIDTACRYFEESFSGHMVHLSGLAKVAGAVPRDIFTDAQHRAEGPSVHADADEHSRMLFLEPGLVRPEVATAPGVVATDLRNMVELARAPDWPGYFGTPAIASPEAGRRAMEGMADAAVDHALRALDGTLELKDGDRVAARVSGVPELQRPLDAAARHEREVEAKEAAWLARRKP
jgi:creatinine amidohydrolase/Fe(II)-dependent formamide hydrolase-like protein